MSSGKSKGLIDVEELGHISYTPHRVDQKSSLIQSVDANDNPIKKTNNRNLSS